MSEVVRSEHGRPLFNDDSQLSQAIEVVEIRNAFVHARGVVDATFLSRVWSSAYEVGQRLSYSIADIHAYAKFFTESVEDLECRAHNKFGFRLPVRIIRAGSDQSF